MSNPWARLSELLAKPPLLRGEVLAHHLDGTSTVELPGGGTLRARGTDVAVGTPCYVQAGAILGEAPDLPFDDVEI